MSMKTGWAVDPVRAAGGRRRYNKLRQVRAEVRRAAIISYLEQQGLSLIARGTQRTLATYFGVSEATISRDVTSLLADVPDPRQCPLCGARALNDEAVSHIEDRLASLLDALKVLNPDETAGSAVRLYHRTPAGDAIMAAGFRDGIWVRD